MEYRTADSYKNYERVGEPFRNASGKMVTRVKAKCDRCVNGIFPARIENGQPVPYPVANGLCFKCGGRGYITDTVRLYTEGEYNTMKKAHEKKVAKKEAEAEAKRIAGYAQKKADSMVKNGFNTAGKTYIVTGDSYSIKDELKEAGFKYDTVLRWHAADPGAYADRCVEVDINDVITFSAWGEGTYKTEAKDFVDSLLYVPSNSQWVGEVGEKIKQIKVTLERQGGFESRYGYSHVYTFVDADSNQYTWFTAKDIPYLKGDEMLISGTIKDHNEYKGTKSTVLTRCKLEDC